MSLKRIHVAVGVIIRENLILLAMRHGHLHQGGKWEFPGGKVEQGEDVVVALSRELKEEIGITVESSYPFMTLSYDYPEKQVYLDIHVVDKYSGQEFGAEGQEIKWVPIKSLTELTFPDANQPIVTKLIDEFSD